MTWQWRAEAPETARRRAGMGVIAQDVQAVFPALVARRGEHLAVAYDGLVGPLMAAVAELAARTALLEEPVNVGPATKDVSRAAPAPGATKLDVDVVAAVFPDAVTKDEAGEPVVAYHALVAPLIEAIKELDDRIRILEQTTR